MEIKITVNNENGSVMAYENEIQVGQLDFIFIKNSLSIEHTRTFEGNEGKGIASTLVMAATDYAVEHRLKVKPTCSYAEAWYKRHPQYNEILINSSPKQTIPTTKVFVMATCPDCTQVKAQLADNPNYELIDIGEHVKNLKQFLALRDNNPAFDEAKAKGYIGIPCFLLEDGTVKFSMENIVIETPPEGAACSLDGKGC
jgi:glutaredoxin-related protein/predicted GNAT family acetyltransferase